MARQSQSHSTIEELESGAERMAEWIREHLLVVSVVFVLALGAAGGFGIYESHRERKIDAASSALDEVETEYRQAMGAKPGDLDVPELANPEAARKIREEYAARFGEIAKEHPGTIAGALARMEQGNLSDASGDLETSVEIWRKTLDGLSDHPGFQAILWERIAHAYEDAGRWKDAADAHEKAAAIEDYPLRYWALADAARCRVEAGDRAAARALALRVQSEAPEIQFPENIRALLQELRTAPAT